LLALRRDPPRSIGLGDAGDRVVDARSGDISDDLTPTYDCIVIVLGKCRAGNHYQ